MMILPDNFDRWQNHDNVQAVWLQNRPICDYCGERIQDEKYHRISNENVCEQCLNEMEITVE
ncbi:MAG: hypothetical protein ACI4DR_01560 [Roseburia sp.]